MPNVIVHFVRDALAHVVENGIELQRRASRFASAQLSIADLRCIVGSAAAVGAKNVAKVAVTVMLTAAHFMSLLRSARRGIVRRFELALILLLGDHCAGFHRHRLSANRGCYQS